MGLSIGVLSRSQVETQVLNQVHQDSLEKLNYHGDVHASGANEIYAAGNATHECLHLSYIADEAGIDFPKPIPLQMDNSTAESFAKNNAKKTKLKHIDARQEWVKVLRDKSILVPVHVPTKLNLADMFTKILTVPEFIRLRNMIMVQPRS